MAIPKLFILSVLLLAFSFSTSTTPASASSRHLLGFFPPVPHFHFPFGNSSGPSNGTFSFPSSGWFPWFHFPNSARPATHAIPDQTPPENADSAVAPNPASDSAILPSDSPNYK
ncbi:hypothetical protein POM88_035532 [Heracleum sosnowskyi]|uniref:Uncharacterized protein n=1 Tax=Heracleum sosnowskyi TaxID=360622 RepID=A0AAD8HLJ6_9APIA|nr:hypothetical protein POM88_035532 [Heracleum sosnowskyi]